MIARRSTWLARDWARGGWTQTVVTGTVIALAMAAAGGFQTGRIPLVPRLIYWISLILGGVLVANIIRAWVMQASWLSGRRWLAAILVATATVVPMSLVVSASSAWISGEPLSATRIWSVAPDVAAITAATTILAVLVAGAGPGRTHQAPEGAPPPRFFSRLSPKSVGAELYALEAQDHYLRLHTSKGYDLILMRLSDAIAELEGLEGSRTHRSWWVARAAVVSAERREGRAILTLRDGAEAPVSRSYTRVLREAGWF